MSANIYQELQNSLDEWSQIEKAKAEREKKDRKIISHFCAQNNAADILNIIELLLKYNGMPEYDVNTIKKFKEDYPDKLTTTLLAAFLDVKDMYGEYLESGGKCDE